MVNGKEKINKEDVIVCGYNIRKITSDDIREMDIYTKLKVERARHKYIEKIRKIERIQQVQARYTEYNNTPYMKKYRKEYQQRPEVKKRMKKRQRKYQKQPKIKERMKETRIYNKAVAAYFKFQIENNF